jgi:hypothetical protein
MPVGNQNADRGLWATRADANRHSLYATNPRNLAAPRVIATEVHCLSAAFLGDFIVFLLPLKSRRTLFQVG